MESKSWEIAQADKIERVFGVTDAQVDRRTLDFWPHAEWTRRGARLSFLQCDEILIPGTNPEIVDERLVQRFALVRELVEFLRSQKKNPQSVFILFFLHKLDPADYRLLRAVDRMGFRYAFLLSDDGDLPQPDFQDFNELLVKDVRIRPFFWRFKHRTKLILMALLKPFQNLKRVFELTLSEGPGVFLYFYYKAFSKSYGLRGPDFWIGKGQGSIDAYYPQALPVGRDTRICWTHLSMYDRYLAVKDELAEDLTKEDFAKEREQAAQETGADKEIALFLGQNAPFYTHPGYRSVIEAEDYYPKLVGLFESIERRLQMKVQKTTHPWGQPERINEWIKPYQISAGDSIKAVAKSRFVMGHCTTALYYAVLFHKPAVFFTTDQLEYMADYGPYTRTMAEQLGKDVINLDRVSPDEIDWEAQLSIDLNKYDAFRNYYIKRPGSPEAPAWDIVWNAIQDPQATGLAELRKS
ncbi:MAG: hypothetical protein NXI24_00445 [bacterium]|nr:hypothetical protein [bacterium]